MSSARKNAGKTASRPSASVSTPPPRTPSAVPLTQQTYWPALCPNRKARSKLPSSRRASAQELSTTVCPCSARFSRPPGSDGPRATPMGRKREFIRAAAATAAPIPPPAERIPMLANCAEPA
jgi:hypothetical protein